MVELSENDSLVFSNYNKNAIFEERKKGTT